ncbi:carbohydrate ABC transporter permease [Sphaerochaeta sp. PS]|uniref:carbohydrate ABC transporter permease n=1 Tax=Sphaerochaeta sp. PS TaxID=3076336 RepID=UPI0028A3003C|nr:carbohydrate ABC transporter permease [Sphaerochaeta sp. PS]MDT4761570.1 carbohydrate ABC transporter permease [Sphaerochaeta sp. PS]
MKQNTRTQKISGSWTIFAYTFLACFTFITLAPLVWMLYSSFKLNGEIMLFPLGLPKQPTFANYHKAFEYGNLLSAFLNSIIYSGFSTVCTVLFSLSAGFALTKFGFRSSKFYMGAFTLGLLITVNSVITPLFIMETSVGLYNTRLGVILPYIAFGLPMAILIASSFIHGIPNALIEAALIDGANYWYIFFKIILMISTPVMATVSVLSFLGNWNEFLLVFTLTGGESMRSLPVSVNSFAGRLNQDYGLQFAALVIATIPMFIFYFVAHNSIVKGFGEGAIKE